MSRDKIQYDEVVRTEAQKEYDVARRWVYGRGAVWSAVTMFAGAVVALVFSFYYGLFGFDDPASYRGFDFGVGLVIANVIWITFFAPGLIMVYRRYLVRVSRRKSNS